MPSQQREEANRVGGVSEGGEKGETGCTNHQSRAELTLRGLVQVT
jgi:hypothetical protein